MLVLSRIRNQRIVIGDNIEIVVLGVHGDRVKLGFNAPSDVQIHRKEVYLRIQSEKADAVDDRVDSASLHHIVGNERTYCPLCPGETTAGLRSDLHQTEC